MKKLILALGLVLGITTYAADVKISQLPLGSAATTGVSDSFPYVASSTNITKRLTLWDLINLPPMTTTYAALASGPTFTGTVTAPTFVGAFSGTVTNATHGLTASTSTNASYFPLFVASSSNSNQLFNLGTGLSFNPSTNALSTTTFVGALTGNVTGNVTGTAGGLSTTLAVGSGGTGLTGGSTGQILRFSGASTIAATTATYPATTTINRLLYSSSANVIADLATANTGVLVTSSGGVPSIQACTTPNRVLRTDGSALTCSQVAAATDISGTLATSNGGTGVTSVTTSPTASSFAGWDANSNLSANALIPSYTTTATAAGTTTMTIASTQTQVWTGSTTQTVKLPTTSVAAGATYTVINNSTGNVTVQSSGANTIVILSGNQTAVFISTKAAPTAAADWNYYTNTQNKVYAYYTGNAGTALTANVTNIDWATKVFDSHSAWNGTTFTAPSAAYYMFSGSVFTTAGVTDTISFYVGGTIKQALNGGTSARVFDFSFGYFLNSGDTLTFRSDTNSTLSNSATLHWISIASQ